MPDEPAGSIDVLLVGFGAVGAICESQFYSSGYTRGSNHLDRCFDPEEKWANPRHCGGS